MNFARILFNQCSTVPAQQTVSVNPSSAQTDHSPRLSRSTSFFNLFPSASSSSTSSTTNAILECDMDGDIEMKDAYPDTAAAIPINTETHSSSRTPLPERAFSPPHHKQHFTGRTNRKVFYKKTQEQNEKEKKQFSL